MKAVHRLWLLGVLVPLLLAGCKGSEQKVPAEKQYPIKGKVVAVNMSKPSVRLDHEDIPGLMKAMEMEFVAENAKVLEGIKPGDPVRGRLKVDSGKYVITYLEKH